MAYQEPVYYGDEPNGRYGQETGTTFKKGFRPSLTRDIVEDVKSRNTDNLHLANSHQFRTKELGVSYNMLRAASGQPLIASIIKTRLNQLLDFSHPQEDKYSTGYKIMLVDRERDPKTLTRTEKKQMKFIEDFISNCGRGKSYYRDDFQSFTKKVMHDSLAFDQINHENVWAKDKMPHSFWAVDAATIRKVLTPHDRSLERLRKPTMSPVVQGHYPSYVQIHNDQIIHDFYAWEMAFGTRNPRTDIRYNGYGKSELEEMISVVTSLLWSFQYNMNFFKNGSHPKGAWRVSSDFSRNGLKEFKKSWRAKAEGVENAHRQIFVEADKLEWIDLQKTNRDMEFSEWNTFLVKTACSVFQIDPAEVNFPVEGGGAQPNQFEKANEQSLKQSRDKGLKPLLKFYQKYMNDNIVDHFFNGKYKLVFAGIDSHTRDEELNYLKTKTEFFQTINETRIELGMKPLDNPAADIIMNVTYTGRIQQLENLQMEREQMEGEGMVDDTDLDKEVSDTHMDIVKQLVGGSQEAMKVYSDKMMSSDNPQDN